MKTLDFISFFSSLGLLMGTKRNDYCDGKAALGNPDSMCFSAILDIKAPPIPAVSDSFTLTAEMVISPARFITHT